jgi:Ca-activated chloride channel family protein
MRFLWPGFLILLVLVPLLVGAYILMLRRRRYAVRYSSLSLVRQAQPGSSVVRRHLPFLLLLIGIASLSIAMARPVVITSLPADQVTIIFAIDVSGSMRSTDIPPSRLVAAEQAAFSFVQKQRAGTQIGLVAFSGYGELIQPPTSDQEALQAAISSLNVGRRTAIGSGILKSLDAIAEVDPNVASSVSPTGPAVQVPPVPAGAYVPDIIVLLTDGVSNTGLDPLDAAKQAVDRGVKIYTIGFGTAHGSLPDFNQNGSSGGFNGGGFGRGFNTAIDEVTLKKIAAMTGGTYYSASSAGELQKVLLNLPTYLIVKHQVNEVSVAFTALGALLAGIALLLALRWNPLM